MFVIYKIYTRSIKNTTKSNKNKKLKYKNVKRLKIYSFQNTHG